MGSAGDSEVFRELDKRWKITSKLLFGGEVGPLSDYGEWLSERADAVFHEKSLFSGKDVSFGFGQYCAGSKRISFDEADLGKKFAPIPINSLKDIDSIAQALCERFAYAGNMILGNSGYIEKSANVSDSYYVLGSSRIGDSKYVAYSSMGRLCDHVFGSAAPGESSYLIRCNDTYHVKRAFELWMTANSSDCYYVFALNNCTDCMFSFNLRAARHAIGNTILPKDKYAQIKSSLLGQMRGELKSRKSLPSLAELVGASQDRTEKVRALLSGKVEYSSEKTDMAPIEEAFSRTCKILFGSPVSSLKACRPWLYRRIPAGQKRKSAISGKELFIGNYAKYASLPEDRTVLECEALKMVEISPPVAGIEKITMDSAAKLISDIAYFSLEYHDGTNSNIIDCMAYAYSSNVLESAPCVQIKDSAYNLWPRSTEHAFGCGVLFDSGFCIHCYQSVKLSRCFECDSCRECADCYFCHNCENVQNGLFCFNVKNLRYAIGNAEVSREEFAAAKRKLQELISVKLSKAATLDSDIFSIGCAKAK